MTDFDFFDGKGFPETLKIPFCGDDACQSMTHSARLRRSPLRDIRFAYEFVRMVEDEKIVETVASRRATSAAELLEKWY